MARLYLVRRTLETFIGPMTVAELAASYKRLEFGLQDEISGSLGPWVQLDDFPKLKKIYPEISRLVENEFLGGWNVSVHPEMKKKRSSSSKGRRRVGPAPLLLLLMVFAAGALFAFSAMKNGRLASRFFSSVWLADKNELREFLETKQFNQFQEQMSEAMPRLMPTVTQSRRVYGEWIPFVRAHAFLNEGKIEGMSAKLVRGSEPWVAPIDCSLSYWQNVWRETPQLGEILEGKIFPGTKGQQILYWDANWLRRRSAQPTSGWIYPRNYYAACLLMATKGANVIANEAQRTAVISRLTMLSEYIDVTDSMSEQPTSLTVATPLLEALYCIERARVAPETASCQSKSAVFSDEVKAYFQNFANRTALNLVLKDRINLTKEASNNATRWRAAVNQSRDPVTMFSYAAELAYFDAAFAGVTLREAARQLGSEYPDVDFSQ